jgi:nitrogenase-associated protein
MATVVFYEKPGCGNNTRQKIWLSASGHTVQAHNLLKENWHEAKLRPFFGDTPVAQWFNFASPRIKSGEVNPATLAADTALSMMIADPLLIRRPLMEVDGVCHAGFDAAAVHAWIGLNDEQPNAHDKDADLEVCPKGHAAQPCPTPEQP